MKTNYFSFEKYLYKHAMKREKSCSSQTTENSSNNLIKSFPILNKSHNQSIFKNSFNKSISSIMNKKKDVKHLKNLSLSSLSKDKSLFKHYLDTLPKLKPIRIKLKPNIDLVQKEIIHNLSQSNYFKTPSPDKTNYLKKQINKEIQLLDHFDSKKVIENIFTLKDTEKKNLIKHKVRVTNYSSYKKFPTLDSYMKNSELNDAILSVNPMINYQRMIEDQNILYIFHNENIKKLRKIKEIKYLD